MCSWGVYSNLTVSYIENTENIDFTDVKSKSCLGLYVAQQLCMTSENVALYTSLSSSMVKLKMMTLFGTGL